MALRRFDDHILIIPDFAAMLPDSWAATQYSPPRWMVKRGVLSFSKSNWRNFQYAFVGPPSIDEIDPISTVELLYLYYFQAPRSFLPDYLAPSQANWNLILCTSGDDAGEDIKHLKSLFSDPSTYKRHEYCTPQETSYTVSAFLDLPSVLEWPIFSSESDPALYLSEHMHFRVAKNG